MLLPIFVLLAARASRSPLTPTFLLCENYQNPMGVDTLHPKLSWIFDYVDGGNSSPIKMKRWGLETADLHASPPITGLSQNAYQIEAATSLSNLRSGHPNLWNSGKVNQTNSLGIQYAGKRLENAETIYWRVRVWDNLGHISNWSKPAHWTTTLLHPTDWKAKWIGAPTGLTYVTLYLRNDINVSFKPKKVLAFASGLGQYQLRIDGKPVGASLAPSWTQYQKSIVVDEIDITSLLKKGRHCLAMMIGNGMYNMKDDTHGSQQTNSIGPIKGFLQLRLEKPNGTYITLGTNSSWKCHATPASYSGEFGGENWDGRKNITGWDQVTYDASSWPNAAETSVSGKLYGLSHDAPAVNISNLESGKISHHSANFVTYNFLYNCPRVPFLKVKGPAGTVVKCMPAEYINKDGTVNQNSMRAGKYVEYTLNGNPIGEYYSPAFWYCGSQYWEITASDPTGKPIDPTSVIASFQTAPEYSSNEAVGEFSSSNHLLNQINQLVRSAMKSNFSSIITDCPHREKSGWLEQLQLMGPSLMYCFDMRQLFHKMESDMGDAQEPNGCVPTMAPDYFKYSRAFMDSDEWGGSFLIVPKLMQQWYDNQSIIDEFMPKMRQYVDYLSSQAKDGIIDYGLGDWDGNGTDPRTPVGLTDTAYYYLLTKDLAHFESKNPFLHDHYSKLAESIKKSFNDKFLNFNTGVYATGSQSGQATALDLGLVPKGLEAKAFEVMVKDIKDHNYAISCGEVGHPSLLRVLSQYGRNDIIAKIHLQTERPGYGYQIARGHNTLCEDWDCGNSGNHFMLGHIMEWIYGDLVGIKPGNNDNGFQTFSIAPKPVPQVSWVNASYASDRGLIRCSWKVVGSSFTLKVQIPNNTSAMVELPYWLVPSL